MRLDRVYNFLRAGAAIHTHAVNMDAVFFKPWKYSFKRILLMEMGIAVTILIADNMITDNRTAGLYPVNFFIHLIGCIEIVWLPWDRRRIGYVWGSQLFYGTYNRIALHMLSLEWQERCLIRCVETSSMQEPPQKYTHIRERNISLYW